MGAASFPDNPRLAAVIAKWAPALQFNGQPLSRFDFSERQAQAIIEMQLQRLTGMEQQKILDELAEIERLIAGYLEILTSDVKLRAIIVAELKEVQKNFGDARRTQIVDDEGEINIEDLIKMEDVVVTVTRGGYLKRTSVDTYRRQTRGGKGRIGMTTRSEDVVEPMIKDGPDAYLIIDDSVQDKRYARKIDLVYRQYSGAEHGVVEGIGVVNLVHTSGKNQEYYPIDYRIYDPKGDGKTKHDHCREMLIRAFADKGIKALTILFDNWYASAENLKFIHQQGRYFISTLQRNRNVSISPSSGYVKLEELPWTEDTYRYGMWVKLKELPFKVHLFVVVTSTGGIDWVITNRPDDPQRPTTAADIERKNAIRWDVEQFHREVKQLAGAKRCQCRKGRSQRNHLACVYFAWVSLLVYAKRIKKTIYKAKKQQWDEYLKQNLRHPLIRAVGA